MPSCETTGVMSSLAQPSCETTGVMPSLGQPSDNDLTTIVLTGNLADFLPVVLYVCDEDRKLSTEVVCFM